MNISELKTSNFLRKEDVDPPQLVTMTGCTRVNMAREGFPPDMRWALHFEEFEKPMVLNSTNGQLIASITGSEESADWTGKHIVLYKDMSVRNPAGQMVGGIRVRAPKAGYKAPAKGSSAELETPPEPEDPDFDEIPY